MHTITTTAPRRRAPRAARSCDDRPRLWGDEPAPPKAAAVIEAPIAPGATAPPVPSAAPAAAAVLDAPVAAAAPRTLEDLIAGAWDDLAAGESTTCPLCATEMAPRWSAGAGVVGGRCGGCGTTLE
ncbi:MAG TPA: hypothetical protein VF533_20950 [Solirubrobacteraceae bacterium]|jgi:hypothetical protein